MKLLGNFYKWWKKTPGVVKAAIITTSIPSLFTLWSLLAPALNSGKLEIVDVRTINIEGRKGIEVVFENHRENPVALIGCDLTLRQKGVKRDPSVIRNIYKLKGSISTTGSEKSITGDLIADDKISYPFAGFWKESNGSNFWVFNINVHLRSDIPPSTIKSVILELPQYLDFFDPKDYKKDNSTKSDKFEKMFSFYGHLTEEKNGIETEVVFTYGKKNKVKATEVLSF